MEYLFSALAENVSQQVGDAGRRKIYGKTLYGVMISQEIEGWVRAHVAELLSCRSFEQILELLWPLLNTHIYNGTFRKCDKPEALKELALAWISGQPFNVILQVLQRQDARLVWGKTFRQFNIEHIVEMCEGGLAYDASLLVGAIIELAGYAAHDATSELTGKLQLFQKILKYGLPTGTTIALYEVGFSDRVIAAELSISLGLVDEQLIPASVRKLTGHIERKRHLRRLICIASIAHAGALPRPKPGRIVASGNWNGRRGGF
jgi:POLQ-like helicase